MLQEQQGGLFFKSPKQVRTSSPFSSMISGTPPPLTFLALHFTHGVKEAGRGSSRFAPPHFIQAQVGIAAAVGRFLLSAWSPPVFPASQGASPSVSLAKPGSVYSPSGGGQEQLWSLPPSQTNWGQMQQHWEGQGGRGGHWKREREERECIGGERGREDFLPVWGA